MKAIKILGLAAVVSALMAMPVMAANNGLANENGRVCYYNNGAKVANAWIDGGSYYIFAGNDGYAINGLVISKAATGERGPVLDVVQMQNAVTNAPLGASNITYVAPVAPAAPVVAVPGAVVAPVAVAPRAELTEQQIANMEDRYYQRHHFTQYFEQYDDDSHRAYCGCGDWAFEPHTYSKGKCTACGHTE